MTPIQLILLCIVVIFFCYLGDKARNGQNEIVKTIGGISIIGFFLGLIWAIFYYL